MATVEKLPMLAEGYEKLTEDLRRLKAERPEIVDAIEEARAHGDLSENAEYHAAKERQGQIEASIADIEDRLSRAQIIDPTTLSGDKIVFGATVTLPFCAAGSRWDATVDAVVDGQVLAARFFFNAERPRERAR